MNVKKKIFTIGILLVTAFFLTGCDRTDLFSKLKNYANRPAAPLFSPSPGVYNNTLSVDITSSTTGAVILYTTDGTTPQHDGSGNPAGTSSTYTTAIAVSSSMTIRAIAFVSDMDDSPESSGTFTLKAETPTFSQSTGTFSSAQTVRISCVSPGAVILFTTDGSDPTHDGSGSPGGTTQTYTADLSISSTQTIRAIAYVAGWTDSDEASERYTFQTADPTFSPEPKEYSTSQNVTISSVSTGAVILYTTDESIPQHDGSGNPLATTQVFSTAILIESPTSIRAIAWTADMGNSSEVSVFYDIAYPEFYVTNFNDNTVTVMNPVDYSITHTVPVGTGPYTIDGNPKTGKLYTGNTTSNDISVINKYTKAVSVISGSFAQPRTVVVDSDLNLIYVASYGSNIVHVVDGTTDTVANTYAVPGGPSGICFHPTQNKIYVSCGSNGSVVVVDTSTGTVLTSISVGAAPRGLQFNPNTGNVIIAVQDGNTLHEIDGTNDTILNSFNVGNGSRRLSLDVTNDILFVSNSTDNALALVNATSGALIGSIPVGTDPYENAFDPVNSRVMVANFGSNNVTVIDPSGPSVANTIAVGNTPRGLCYMAR